MLTTVKEKDYVKALILERQNALHLTRSEMGDILGFGRNSMTRYINDMHTDEWPLGVIKDLCAALGITAEELREAVRYQ